MEPLDENLEFNMFGDQATSPQAMEMAQTKGLTITDDVLVKCSTNLRFKMDKLYKDGRKVFLTQITHLNLNGKRIQQITNLT